MASYQTDASVPLVWRPGDVLLDLYEVEQLLGAGGMGQVVKVVHRAWDQVMAVKSPRPELVSVPRAMESFEREAETWVKLGLHLNIATCFYVRRMGGVPRVFSEYVDGGSLLDWIAPKSGEAPRLYQGTTEEIVQRILDIGIQFAWGLYHAHEQSLVHQDVKPANVLMTAEGIAKVSDFGLARGTLHAAPSVSQEQILVSAGGYTPAYCSPEQERGEKLNQGTDIWSWAVSMLHLFCRRLSWKSGSQARSALEDYLAKSPGEPGLLPMPRLLMNVLRDCLDEDRRSRPRDFARIIFTLQEAYKHVNGSHYPRPAPLLKQDVSSTLTNRAVSLIDLGRKQEAEAALGQALDFEPQHVEATYNLGLMHWREGRLTDAQLLARLRETRHGQAGPTAGEALEAQVHLERGNIEGAESVLNQPDRKWPASLQSVMKKLPRLRDKGRCLLQRFTAHTGRVITLALSQDGRFLASGGVDRTVHLWDVAKGACVVLEPAHAHRIESLCFSNDGRLVASGAEDRVIRIWDVQSGQCIHSLRGHLHGIQALCFLDDGIRLLSGSFDETFKLWDVQRGVSLWTFEEQRGPIISLIPTATSDSVWSISGDGTLTLWDLNEKKVRFTRQFSSVGSTGVSLRRDGRQIMLGQSDGSVELVDVASGKAFRVMAGEPEGLSALHWIGSTRFVLTGGGSGVFRLWDTETGRCLRTFEGLQGKVRALATDPSGEVAYVADQEPVVKSYRLSPHWSYQASASFCRIMATSQSIAAGDEHAQLVTQAQFAFARRSYSQAADLLEKARACPGFARSPEILDLWGGLYTHLQPSALRGIWMQQMLSPHAGAIRSIAVANAQPLLLTTSDDERVKLWRLHPRGIIGPRGLLGTLDGHIGKVAAMTFTPDGSRALTGGEEEVLHVWDLANKTGMRRLRGHKGPITAIAALPDGVHAISASADGTIHLWDTQRGESVQVIQAHERAIRALTTDRAGRQIVSAGEDQKIRIWTSRPMTLRHEVETSLQVHSVAIDDDGKHFLTGDGSGNVTLWDMEHATALSTRAIKGPVNAVGFCARGRFAYACGKEGLVWNLEQPNQATSFAGSGLVLTAATVTEDARWLITGGADGSLHFWFLDWALGKPS